MSEHKEKISAFLDDALPSGELGALSNETAIEQKTDQREGLGVASRYQLMGDVLRGQLGDASMIDVRVQVREALRNESIDNSGAVDHRTPITHDSDSRLGSWLGSWFGPAWYRPLGGLAIAASVAMIMVVTVTHEETGYEKGSLVAEGSIENAPVVSLPVSTVVINEVDRKNAATQAYSKAILDAYLAEHAEFAAQDTIQGRMPYARAVSYEAE